MKIHKSQRKGIMLITVLIISALLFIFFLASVSALSKSNTNAATSVEREEVMGAVKAGMYELTMKLNERLQSNPTKPLSDITALNVPRSQWIPVNPKQTNYPRLSYKYECLNGVGVVGGKYEINEKKSITRFNRVSYIIEPMGVAAQNVIAQPRSEDPMINKETKPSITSVYSYETQLPFEAWIGAQANINQVYYRGSLQPVNPLDPIASTSFRGANLNDVALLCQLAQSLNLLGEEWTGNLYINYLPCDIVYQKIIDENLSKFEKFVAKIFSFFSDDYEVPKNLKEYFSEYDDIISGHSDEGIGISINDNFNFFEGVGSDFPPLPPDTVIERKNMWLVPYDYTVVWNGDLCLTENSLLIVTGNLLVKGNIRGSGYLFVLNNLYFAPKTAADNPNLSDLENGNLIAYAGKNIYAFNPVGMETINLTLDPSFIASMPPDLLIGLVYFCQEKNYSLQELMEIGLKNIIERYVATLPAGHTSQIWRNKITVQTIDNGTGQTE